jgi:hypothetical protein
MRWLTHRASDSGKKGNEGEGEPVVDEEEEEEVAVADAVD